MKQLMMATDHALAAFDVAVIANTALNSVMELDNGDISDAQRNAENARRDEFDQVHTMFTVIGSNIYYFQSSYLDPTLSPDTDAVLLRFF